MQLQLWCWRRSQNLHHFCYSFFRMFTLYSGSTNRLAILFCVLFISGKPPLDIVPSAKQHEGSYCKCLFPDAELSICSVEFKRLELREHRCEIRYYRVDSFPRERTEICRELVIGGVKDRFQSDRTQVQNRHHAKAEQAGEKSRFSEPYCTGVDHAKEACNARTFSHDVHVFEFVQ